MYCYRITLTKYADKLLASGRAARWNPNKVDMIYTASSRALACLENAVHRDQTGLMQLFSVLTIEFPDNLKTNTIYLNDLPVSWRDYNQMFMTQNAGERWINENRSAILSVPSSIIDEENNYLLNPHHEDFKRIKIIKTEPFIFDTRIKQ